MAKNKAPQLSLSADIITSTPYIEYSDVEQLANNETSITFKHKKPRSSKYLVSTVLKANVLYVTAADEDGLISLAANADSDIVETFDDIVSIEEGDDGMIALTDSDGDVVFVNASALGDVTGDAPEDEDKPKKKAPAKKAKAKKEEVDEDEDEDDWGDDD